MARFIKNRSKSTGEAPGSLIFLGKQKMEMPLLQLIEYDFEVLEESPISDITTHIIPDENINKTHWINIYGIHDMGIMKSIGEKFSLHPLLLEDFLDVDQLPKWDVGDNYIAIILKMLSYNKSEKKIHSEQLSMVIGSNFLLTLQEQKGDVFDPVRKRIREKKGRIRSCGNDYLAYALLDTIADNYLILIESLGREIEALEENIFNQQQNNIAESIYQFKTELNYLRKSIRPLKEVIKQMVKDEDPFFHESNLSYYSDLLELIEQSNESIELYNNMLSDQLNIFNTMVSNKMNQVMKTLTIFASIFIPLTFMAGIYGMNFQFMPELTFKYSYPIFWAITIVVIVTLLMFFKKKKWI